MSTPKGTEQEFTQNFRGHAANPFPFTVLLIARISRAQRKMGKLLQKEPATLPAELRELQAKLRSGRVPQHRP
jgi:hypothetical protein